MSIHYLCKRLTNCAGKDNDAGESITKITMHGIRAGTRSAPTDKRERAQANGTVVDLRSLSTRGSGDAVGII